MAIILWHDPDFPITEAHHEYWAALGRFIHRFAMLEQEIHSLLTLP
jgi:peptidoglycan/xylan/chitin deacetylase (PgdA/CDA1 family)